jgi:hypothetical protein
LKIWELQEATVLDGSKCWTGSKNLRLKAEVCRSSRRNVCLHFTVLALPSERVPFRSMHRPVTLHRSRDIIGFATPQWLRPSLCPWYTAQRRVICPGVLGSTAPSVHRTDKSSLFEYTPPRARGRRDHTTQLRGLWSGKSYFFPSPHRAVALARPINNRFMLPADAVPAAPPWRRTASPCVGPSLRCGAVQGTLRRASILSRVGR